MKSILKIAAALSVIVTASTSLASPKLVYLDVASMPQGAERFVKLAVREVNEEINEEVIDIAGLYLGEKIEQDGVSTISFRTLPSALAKPTVKSVTYKSADSVEFDIIVHTNFDSSNDEELANKLKAELRKQAR